MRDHACDDPLLTSVAALADVRCSRAAKSALALLRKSKRRFSSGMDSSAVRVAYEIVGGQQTSIAGRTLFLQEPAGRV